MRNKYLIYIIIILLLIILLSGFKTFTSQTEKLIKEGNNLYRQGEYEKAGKIYKRGLSKEPEYPKLNYNLANVKYQTDRYLESLELYQKSTDSANKYLLLGNIVYELAENVRNPRQKIKLYQQALESYKDGIIKYPREINLKYNYEYVEKKLEDMQNHQQQNQDQQSNGHNNDKQNNKDTGNSDNQDNQNKQKQKDNNQGNQSNEDKNSTQDQQPNGQNEQKNQQKQQNTDQNNKKDNQESKQKKNNQNKEQNSPDQNGGKNQQQIMQTLKVLEKEEEENLKNNQTLHQGKEEEEHDW